GVVTVADPTQLNFETTRTYTITVQASDGQPGGASTQTFIIAVANANPSTLVDTDGVPGGSVTEGAANGTPVGITAFATDPNGPPVTYSLTNDANGAFAIDPTTGVVTVANSALLNAQTNPKLTITVRADDGAGGFSTRTATIAVQNVTP